MSVMACKRVQLQGTKYIMKKVSIVFVHNTPTGSYLCLYQIFQIIKKLWCTQEFGLEIHSGAVTKKQSASVSHLSCDTPTWPDIMSLPSIIKLSQTVWELWPAQDLGFRGHKYIMEKVRVVSLACDMPTGPHYHPYQILSKFLRVSKL